MLGGGTQNSLEHNTDDGRRGRGVPRLRGLSDAGAAVAEAESLHREQGNQATVMERTNCGILSAWWLFVRIEISQHILISTRLFLQSDC